MGSRMQSHQLSNGLYVSGRPEQQQKDKPTMGSRAVPYTGGDVKKSGELGKMFDIQILEGPGPHPPPSLKSSRPSTSGSLRSGSGSTSGPLSSRHTTSSGPMTRKSSGPMPLQPTGLITSGPLGSSTGRRSGHLDSGSGSGPGKPSYGAAVTSLGSGAERGLVGFVRRYPDAELRGALDGQFVKVTGVVTCGSIPLESSYQKVPRCVYVSTELYEYKGLGGKSANPKHRCLSWGSRHSEKYVADFYISDFQSGLRALVKAGYGAKVAPFVKPATAVEVTKENKDLSPSFLRWLADRSLSSDDRIMRLKEGYIKEGSTVSVMGVVRRHDNILMIVPPSEPVSTGCQWVRCLLPTYVEGLILTCDDNQNADVVPV
nr:putative membrane protein [Quercus suber]